jgi:site-specific recombinase XerD
VASERASLERAAILRGEAGIGKKRKDISFDKAKDHFIQWMETNKRPRTVRVYRQQLEQLAKSFGGKTLGQISSFDIERHNQDQAEQGARVVANREVAVMKNLFNKANAWNLYEGDNPVTRGHHAERIGRASTVS